MFKFGRYTRNRGPYDEIKSPVNFVTSNRAGAIQTAGRQKVTAQGFGSYGQGNGFGGGPVITQQTPFGVGTADSYGASHGASIGGAGGSAYNIDRYNPVFDQLEEGTILEDWIPRDGAGLDLLFRRIYLRDPILGPGVDLLRNLPWSDSTLQGVKDKKVLQIYQDSYDSLNTPELMPDITGNWLVIGRDISSLIFDERRGIFSGVVPHDPDFIRVSPIPVFGFDPLCDFKLSPGFRKFINSSDPRAIDARKALPPSFLDAAQAEQGFLPLDPVGTIYLARKTFAHDQIGTSILTRSLYFWAIEKALLNAQLASTRRRARSFTHVMMGLDGTWEPTPEEMDGIAGMIIQATEDPVGGVVATRTGVTISEPVGGGQDFYKWSDELELFSKYKMQCLGISDALLSGDATYNNQEQARSVFVEILATIRFRICHKFFTQKFFPTIARIHGFVKRTKAEIDHNIRISREPQMPSWANLSEASARKLTQRMAQNISPGDLIIPTIDWQKQLKPNQDEKAIEILERLKQNDYPVTLQQWAQAAGCNPKTIYQQVVDDKKLLHKIESIDVGGATDGVGGEENLDEMPTGEEGEENAGEGGESAEEMPEGEGNAGEDVDKILEQTPLQRERQVGSSVTSSVRQAVDDLAIWHGYKCGQLRREDARKVVAEFQKVRKSKKIKTVADQANFLVEKVGAQKAPIMAYVLNRLGLTSLPIDPETATIISNSARNKIKRHTNFNSHTATQDLKRCDQELGHLGRMIRSSKPIKQPKVKLPITPPNITATDIAGVE